VHPLDYVSTVVEDTADVLCVYCAGEVWVTVVPAITACCEFVPDEVFCPCDSWLNVFLTVIWCGVTKVLLVQEENYRDTVGLIVFSNDHVIATAGHYKDDGSYICAKEEKCIRTKQILKGTNREKNAMHFVFLLICLPFQNSLLCAVNQLILIGALITGPHSIVLPQTFSSNKYIYKESHKNMLKPVNIVIKFTSMLSIPHIKKGPGFEVV
uniref:Ig-like domain-containing protein n=1 Tax=Electrophorus electricus TaxID=8005 RepID=A0AAY5EXL6_ELEEL